MPRQSKTDTPTRSRAAAPQKRPRKPSQKLDWRPAFLAALAHHGHVTRACEEADVSRPEVYATRKSDAAFAEAWEQAREIGAEALEDEAIQRAVEGWEEPVYHKGMVVGTVRRYSDMLLKALLEANLPHKFRRRTEISGPGGGPIETRSVLSFDQVVAIAREELEDDGSTGAGDRPLLEGSTGVGER